MQEEIQSGHFQSVDDIIVQGVYALREKSHGELPVGRVSLPRPEGQKSLAQLFAESPFKGLAMEFERFPDTASDL